MITDVADRQRGTDSVHALAIGTGPINRTVGFDSSDDSASPVHPRTYQNFEQDHMAVDLGVRDSSAFENDLLLDTASPGAKAEHHHTGYNELYTDTEVQIRARSPMSSESRITSGHLSSLGTGEDRATLVFGSTGEASFTTPTEGVQSVEEDLLFGEYAGIEADAEFSTLPS